MKHFNLRAIALAAGLSATPAMAQEEPYIPTFPSNDEIAAMSADDLTLAVSRLNCVGQTVGPFADVAERDAYVAEETRYADEIYSRLAPIQDDFMQRTMEEDALRYLEILQSDPLIAESGLDAETIARIATGFQIGFGTEYPQATCNIGYFMGPFASAKNMDLEALWDMAQNMSPEDLAGGTQALNMYLGTEGLTIEDLMLAINPDHVQAMQDFVYEAEADEQVTMDELLELMRHRARIAGENPADYEIASVNRVAGDMLRAIGTQASTDNVYALSYAMITAAEGYQRIQEIAPEVLEPPVFEGPTSQDALDAMRDSTLGGEPEDIPSSPAEVLRDGFIGFEEPEPGQF